MKKHIAIIFGCDSLEHNVSLMTGYNVGKVLVESDMYNITFVGILKNGIWKYSDIIDDIIINTDNIHTIHINEECPVIYQIGNGMINNIPVYKAFLATHGMIGEDGNLQGFLKLNQISYTGNHVDGSVLCFNKIICKYVAQLHNIKVVPYIYLNKYDIIPTSRDITLNQLGDKYIVKINKGGSSIGVYNADINNIKQIINGAFQLDDSIIIEKDLNKFRELSIGLLRCKEEGLIHSDIGEFMKETNHFTFEDKYNNNKENRIRILSHLADNIKQEIIHNAMTIYRKLNLKSYVRIDFFFNK